MTTKLFGEIVLLLATTAALFIMTRLALKVPAPNLELFPPGTRRRWFKLALTTVGMLCLAAAMLRVIVWLSQFQNGLRYFFTGYLVVFIASTARQLPSRLGRRLAVATIVPAAIAWFVWPGWLTANLLALFLCAVVVATLQLRTAFLRFAGGSLAIVAVYDMVQVYGTGEMLKGAKAAVSSWLPVLLVVPQHLQLNAGPEAGIGLGDLAISAVMIVMAGRIGQRTGNRWVYYAALLGYVLGLVAAGIVVAVTRAGQPATIFLIPAITLSVAVAAALNGHWSELKRRQDEQAETDVPALPVTTEINAPA